MDDLVAISPADSNWGEEFYRTYKQLCKDIGVSLASTEDPDKAFPPSTRGLVLGIMFCTIEWKWWIEDKKLDHILNDINDLRKVDETDLRTVWSVVGKILYVKELCVPGTI